MMAPMRVRALAPLSTGLVCFRDPEPRASIVIKRALRLVDGPRPWLAPDAQTPELRGPKVAFDGTAHPDDFAPRKLRTEILVVGCAHSAAPSTEVPVELRLGAALHKRAWVRSPAPAMLHPLVPAWVAVEPPVSAWFGPRPLPELGVGPARDAREAAWSDGWLELPPGDRGESQQCAAAEQQTWERIGPRSQLWLRGLARGAEIAALELPSDAPWCALLLRGRRGAVEWSELELRLETLHLDATSGLLELGYRGELDVSDFESPPDLVVGVSQSGFVPERAELEPGLARVPPESVARPVAAALLPLAPAGVPAQRAAAPPAPVSLPPPLPPPAPWAPPRDAALIAAEPPAAPPSAMAEVLEEETTSAGADPQTIRPEPMRVDSPKTLPPDALDPSALPFAVAPLAPPPALAPSPPPVPPSDAAGTSAAGALPFVGAARVPPARASTPSAAGLPFAGAIPGSSELRASVDGSGTVALRLESPEALPFRGAARAAPTPPPPVEEASYVDGSATLALRPERSTALPFQAALGAPRASPAARPAETAGLPFLRRDAPEPAPSFRGPARDQAAPSSAERAGDTLPPAAHDLGPEERASTGPFAPPPRLPSGFEPSVLAASSRAPLPTLPAELGPGSALPFEAQDAPTPPAPAVAPPLPFAPRPASMPGPIAPPNAPPAWVPSIQAQPLPPRSHGARPAAARRDAAERELDAAAVALVRTLPEEARHEAIRGLGLTALAYARAEQRQLEELERELGEGRSERLAQLLSALHERALMAGATSAPPA